MAVGVDQPGAHDLAAGVDHPLGRRTVEPANVDDAIARDRDVSREARVAGPIGDPAAADQYVEHSVLQSYAIPISPGDTGKSPLTGGVLCLFGTARDGSRL